MKKVCGLICVLYLLCLPSGCIPYYEPAGYGETIGQDSAKNTPESYGPIRGIASFMADEMQGKQTASGEIFNLRELVAAHRSLPFGTQVRVTNLKNDKSVVVRIIDRGPFVTGRVIDVSFQAAKELGFLDSGTTEVELSVVR
ncbi:MAG: septal ring lytic transglycosylase RlpA family protein [Calditrichaeota bacterium]|nr:MAG: septal ring lytic transglycosylase RlpA family protein [Calditrichota bacterium]